MAVASIHCISYIQKSKSQNKRNYIAYKEVIAVSILDPVKQMMMYRAMLNNIY